KIWKRVAQAWLVRLLAIVFLGGFVLGEIGSWFTPEWLKAQPGENQVMIDPKLRTNRQNFEQIREGATREDVIGILGLPADSKIGRLKGTHYWFEWARWVGPDCTISVKFTWSPRRGKQTVVDSIIRDNGVFRPCSSRGFALL